MTVLGGVVVASMFLGEEYRSMFLPVRANHERYCARHGYHYVALTDDGMSRIPMGTWQHAEAPQKRAKFAFVKQLLDEGASHVFWTDADSLFVNQSRSLDFALQLDRDLVISGDGTHVANSGHFLIRNSSWSRLLLTRAIRNPYLASWKVEPFLGPYVSQLKAHIPCRAKQPYLLRPELADMFHWLATVGCAADTSRGNQFACSSDNCVLCLLLGGAHSQHPDYWVTILFDMARETVSADQTADAHAALPPRIAARVALLPQRAMNSYMPPTLSNERDVEAAVRPEDLLVHVVSGEQKVEGRFLSKLARDMTIMAALIRLGRFNPYAAYEIGSASLNEALLIHEFDATELRVLFKPFIPSGVQGMIKPRIRSRD